MSPHADLSPTMAKAMAVAIDHGGELVRLPGAFWTWRDCPRHAHNGQPEWYAETSTIAALVKRGALEYSEWQEHKVPRPSKPASFPIAAKVRMEWIDGKAEPAAEGKPDFSLPMKAFAGVLALKPKSGDKVEFPCPKCGQPFHWYYGGPRAMRGACTTPNCLAFMS